MAVIQALSALPLFAAPNVPVAPSAPGSWRAARLGLAIFLPNGWMAACFFFVWQVVLFVSLGRSLAAYGGAMALAALVGAVVGLVFGRQIDRGGGRRTAVIAYLVAAGVVVLRAASLGSPWLAVAANATGSLAYALTEPAMMTAVYNLAKASPCPLRFHVATEGAWDVGCSSACLVAAGLAALQLPLSIAILMALPATAAIARILWRYYGPTGQVTEPPPLITTMPEAP